MDKETLQKHYNQLSIYCRQYEQSELVLTLNYCRDYVYQNRDLYDYIPTALGAGYPEGLYSELFTGKYFLKDMKKILLAIKSDIDEME